MSSRCLNLHAKQMRNYVNIGKNIKYYSVSAIIFKTNENRRTLNQFKNRHKYRIKYIYDYSNVCIQYLILLTCSPKMERENKFLLNNRFLLITKINITKHINLSCSYQIPDSVSISKQSRSFNSPNSSSSNSYCYFADSTTSNNTHCLNLYFHSSKSIPVLLLIY